MMQHSSHQATPKGGRLQNLPPELSIQILKECIPQRMDRKGRQFFLALRTLFSDWREVCYTTPEWWSTLSINFVEEMDVGDEERLKSLLQAARGWFNRSGIGANLELSVVEGTAFPETGVPILVQFLHDQINRWKALDLDIGSNTFMLALMMLRLPIPMEWPALASLKVKLQREWQGTMGVQYVDISFLKFMPSLRRLQLIHFNGSEIPVSPQITSLETVGIDPFSGGFPDDIHLPSLFSSLTNLTLKYDSLCEVDVEVSTFECLETLNLVGEMDVLGLLDRFVCPVLRGFSFEFQPYDCANGLHRMAGRFELMDLLQRSQKTIQSLKLSFVALKPPHNPSLFAKRTLLVQDVLKMLDATLEEVEVWQWPWGGDVKLEDIPSLPHLRTLTIGQLSCEEGEPLLGWLLHRAHGLSQSAMKAKQGRSSLFPRLYLKSPKDRNGFPDKEVDKFVEEGLDVYIRGKYSL